MELIISILVLFILVNSLLKLSLGEGWQAIIFGLLCGIFIVISYPYAILQSKTQLSDYLQNTAALKNMAVIVTFESGICFAYCITALRGQQKKGWMKILKWYPGLLIFPVLFYLQTELIFSFPGISFAALSYGLAVAIALLIPLMCSLFKYLLPEKELRLEVHFLVSLFVCIIGLLTTVNGNVTYQAVREPVNRKALLFALSLFLLLFLAGMAWNKFKWIVQQNYQQRRKSGKS